MSHKIHCKKLGIEAEGLDEAPYPGELGDRIYNEISAKAWDMWLAHQTMLINEYRLSLLDDKARKFLETEMERFLFSDGSTKPAGYTPEEKSQ